MLNDLLALIEIEFHLARKQATEATDEMEKHSRVGEAMKWIDARKTLPPDPGEIPARYLVILDTKSPAQNCKTWAGMGETEFASYYRGWNYPWNARGSLEVAYWAEPPKFDMQWEMNADGTPGEWVPNSRR